MKLVQLYSDGRFFDEKSELVASPISIWRNAKLNGLAMRKDKLVALLKESDTSVFWAFLGEKNVLAPLYEHKKDGFSRCELSGAYFLNRQKAVHGSFSQFSRGEA